jgi:phosphonate transport system substrate-binding protein
MLNRRHLLGILASTAATLAAPAGSFAADWKTKYPQLTFAVIPDENASSVTERYTPFAEYLSKELGVPVKLRVVSDYAGVIEGQRSGQIELAMYSPASYAKAYLTGVKTTPFAMEVANDGAKAYYSVFYVKKDSPYQKIDDLKGKKLALVDPNSTSGNTMPRFALNKMGIDADTFFSKVIYSGTHENAIIALQQGLVDVAANWWVSDDLSNLKRMDGKGLAKYDDFRIIYKSDPIVNSPMAYLTALPDDLKAAIREAVFSLPQKNKALFDKMFDGKASPWVPVDHNAYETTIQLVKFVDDLRRKKR